MAIVIVAPAIANARVNADWTKELPDNESALMQRRTTSADDNYIYVRVQAGARRTHPSGELVVAGRSNHNALGN